MVKDVEVISDRNPAAAAAQLYNDACARTTRTRLNWLNSSIDLEYQGGNRCRVSLVVFIPHTAGTIHECVYFNNIPDSIECYEALKSKISHHPGTIIAATVFAGMILAAIVRTFFGV